MKKLLLPTIFTIIFIWPSLIIANDFAGGSGTESDPYLVANAVHLDNVRLHLDAHFQQINDISLDTLDFQDGMGWNPIGSCDSDLEGEPFTGSYNGDNFVISGLFINRSDSIPSGLFGCTQNATLLNINLSELEISSAYWSGGLLGYNLPGNATLIEGVAVSGELNLGNFSGGIAGQGDSIIIINCTAAVVISAEAHVGGLIGAIANGEVRNSSVSGSLSGDETLGGAVGRLNDAYMQGINVAMNINSEGGESGGVVGEINRSTVESCSFSGEIISGNRELGGIAGILLFGALIDCTSDGYLECLGTGGGIIGTIANGEIIGCNSTMDVFPSAGGGGGIAGIANRSLIRNCTYSGTVGSIPDGFFNGGIVGFVGQDVEIINVSSSGFVESNRGAGGIVGSLSNNSSIRNSTSSSFVFCNFRAGGIVGVINGSSVDSVSFTGTVETIVNEAGGIVGIVEGNNLSVISNAENFGNVSGNSRIGGILGLQSGFAEIMYARNFGNITGEENYIGGIVGISTGNINMELKFLYNEGDIEGRIGVAGIIGSINNINDVITIDNVFSSGNIEGTTNTGGLIGEGTGIRITNSSSNASVYTFGGRAGGIVGEISQSEIDRCFFYGDVESIQYSGGIAATITESTISNSYAKGSSARLVGGIVARSTNSEIFHSYSVMEAAPPSENNIVSEIMNSEIINSYFSLSPMSDFDPENPEGLPLEQMTYRYGTDVYVDWDFNNVWRHDFTGEINDGLPFFRSADDEGFYFVLLGINDSTMGEATGEGYFDEGDEVILTAEASEGFRFLYWEDTDGMIISENENYQFTMPAGNVMLTAVFDEATAVREIDGMLIKIYPNPVTDQLYIYADQKVQEVSLYNCSGQLIRHFAVNNNTVSINTSEIPVGTYLLSIQSDDQWIHESIQVIR